MIVALILLGLLVAVGSVLFVLDRSKYGKQQLNQEPEKKEDTECCGLHAVCEKKYAAPPDKIVYYDDEELDALSHRDPSTYTQQELEQLQDVLLTLRPEDAYGWSRSLEQRHIQLPQDLRDQLIILMS